MRAIRELPSIHARLLLAASCALIGCGNPITDSQPPSAPAVVRQTPEQICESRSQVHLTGDAQGVALMRAAIYDDCLVGYQTDPKKINNFRHQGQLEAFKSYVAMGAGSGSENELIKTKIIASDNPDVVLGFFYLLKTSGKFSEADLKKLDAAFPNLQMADAFHAYEQHPIGGQGP